MSVLLLPNEVLSMTAQAARRLVDAGDGTAPFYIWPCSRRGATRTRPPPSWGGTPAA